MDKITIELKKEDGRRLELKPSSDCAGSRFDNLATGFSFIRPEAYTNDNLILYFSDNYSDFEPVSIGSGNVFIIGGRLTRYSRLRLQAAFERDGDVIERSDTVTFTLRESLPSGTEPLSSPPGDIRPVPDVSGTAFTGAGLENNTLVFYNMVGEKLCEIDLQSEPENTEDKGMTCLVYQ